MKENILIDKSIKFAARIVKLQKYLSVAAYGKMIYGGVYSNKNGKLPSKMGRIWYEADINYIKGYRNSERVLFSNDGLIFVTYNHYQAFIEIQ